MRDAARKPTTPRKWDPTLLCAGAKESEVAGGGMQGGSGSLRSGDHGQTCQSSLYYWDWGARDVRVCPFPLFVLSPAPSSLLLLLYLAWSCSRFLPGKMELIIVPIFGHFFPSFGFP